MRFASWQTLNPRCRAEVLGFPASHAGCAKPCRRTQKGHPGSGSAKTRWCQRRRPTAGGLRHTNIYLRHGNPEQGVCERYVGNEKNPALRRLPWKSSLGLRNCVISVWRQIRILKSSKLKMTKKVQAAYTICGTILSGY